MSAKSSTTEALQDGAPLAAGKPSDTPKPRPGFPLRIASATAVASASKKVADGAYGHSSPATNTSKYLVKAALGAGLARPSASPQMMAALRQPMPTGISMASDAIRARMVQKLAAQGLSDGQVLAAMGKVERHCFVDSALANQAYEDTSLPIGLGQTISKPNVVARMLELLMRGSSDKLGRVLEIGTGCGYQAAVLAQLATEVYSMERLRGLHEKARDNLRPFRLANVHLLFGDGMLGYPKGAPYAAIIAAAGGDAIPAAWIDQLAVGGRLVAPMHTAGGAQSLVVVDKTAGGIRQTTLEAVHFVPLKSGTS